jgi:L-aspartate oxidase
MNGLPAETDFVVIGVGVAGLRAAIELADAGRVLLVSKSEIPDFRKTDPKTQAAWLSDEDRIILHLQDTLDAGDGLSNPAAVKILVEEGIERIEELVAWGAQQGSKLVFEPESAGSKSRLLHAQGDFTARLILRALHSKVESLPGISFVAGCYTTGLVVEDGRVTAVSLLDEKGNPREVPCSSVLLATGGMGQIYRHTTNPGTATADGLALAARAGAEVGDLEFIQFHPTALYMKKVPRFFLPEGLLAEGAYLRNIEMNRFMAKYHPLGERAPRDVVSRAMVHEMEVSRAKDPVVYLDLTHLNAAQVQKRFAPVHSGCAAHNLDITEDLIPVRPAAHCSLGGVRTDLEGRTTLAGLYAAGEVAASGVHGANRLPSNSLLEDLVYGARAGRSMRGTPKPASRPATPPTAAYSNGPVDLGVEELIGQIQDLMWNEVGVVRTRAGMQKAVHLLQEWAAKVDRPKTRRAHEAANLHLAALLVARSALAREESRGTHYRMDYPDHDDKKFRRHSVVRGEKILFVA